MIKNILFVSLIATSGLMQIHSMQKPDKDTTVEVCVNDHLLKSDEEDTLIDDALVMNEVLANQCNITVREDNNFGAMFVNGYYKPNAVVGSTNKVIARGNQTTVDNYYGIEGENLVFAIDTNNKMIGCMAVTDGSTIDESTLSEWTSKLTAPTGYTVDENFYDEGTTFVPGTTEIHKNTILRSKLVYDETYAEYQVSVFGDTASVTSIDGDNVADQKVDVKFDKKVKVTSTAENFQYWKVAERIVSYEKEYTFSVYTDVVIEEVTGEDTLAPTPVVNLYHTEAKDDMSSLYICGYELPAGYTMVETGMLFGGYTYETAKHRVMANRITDNNEFAVRYTELDGSIHAAYLVYEDSEGNIDIAYDNGYGYEQLYFWDLEDSANSSNIEELVTYSNDGITLDQNGTLYKDKDKENGVRIGSSNGEFIINLPEGKTADKVFLGAREWDYDEQYLNVNGVSTPTLNDTFDLYEVDIESSSTITISKGNESKGRGLINYVGFCYSDRNESPEQKIGKSVLDSIVIGDNNSIYEGVTLPSKVEDYDITWTWDDMEIEEIDNDFIPEDENDALDLVATVNIDGVESTRDITVNLISRQNKLQEIKDWVLRQETFENLSLVTSDLILPDCYDNTDLALSWTSLNEAITDEGVVTRGSEDVEGQIAFDVTIAGETETAYFDVTVLKEGDAGLTEQEVYSVGFEESEGFTTSSTYNNTYEKDNGPDGYKWQIMEGTPSIKYPISDGSSLQFRDYTSNSVTPYAYTEFAISNATKVDFKAKNTSGLNLIVQYSNDGGATWTGDQKFELSTSASSFTYELPTTVSNCQFKFSVDPDSTRTNKAKLYIDDVIFYGLM